MKLWLKIFPPALLALFIVMLCSATFAAYKLGTTEGAMIQAKSYSFQVNGSSSQALSLGMDASISPGESCDIPILLDAAGSEVAVNARVTLTAQLQGACPPGFAVSLDGVEASGGGALTATREYTGLHDAGKTVYVRVSWDDPGDIDYAAYAGFSMDVSLLVESEQAT